MPVINRSVLPLLVLMAALGLGLAFSSPAEARSDHYRIYSKSAFSCPAHGPKCGTSFRERTRLKNRQPIACVHYNRYYRLGDYADRGPGPHHRRHR